MVSVYKTFSKLIADRLKLVIHKLISKCQSAFGDIFGLDLPILIFFSLLCFSFMV